MRRFITLAPGNFCCRGTGVLLILFLATSTAPAAVNLAPAGAPESGVGARDVAPVSDISTKNHCTLAPRASEGENSPRLRVGLTSAPGYLTAAILGDRQRMVQVALIFMGVAILILTRGNRF